MSAHGGEVPEGTRNARTGFPVGQSSAAGNGNNGGWSCALTLLGWAGGTAAAAAAIIARARGWAW